MSPQRQPFWTIYALTGVSARVAEAIPSTRRMSFMNNLSRDKQIQIIACLTEGQSIRATERITGIHRDTIMRLGERVGRGCAELHDRIMVGVRCGRLELDKIWGYGGKKHKKVQRHEIAHKGDQYTFIGMASSAKAIISYRTGKRDSENKGAVCPHLHGPHSSLRRWQWTDGTPARILCDAGA